ncbi:MAG: glycosyl hydrolase [Terracidiphilus sp.]
MAVLLLAGALANAQTANTADPLKSGFENPPASARPRVWWHWMNGNISKEGIKLDLEWMHRAGLGGFHNFDAALQTPLVVDHRLAYMTPEWKDTFQYATTLADQFGMEEGIAGSPGWSESGGPWVPAPEGMKKYVWSETSIEGGKPFTGKLAHPPQNTGGISGSCHSRHAARTRGRQNPSVLRGRCSGGVSQGQLRSSA